METKLYLFRFVLVFLLFSYVGIIWLPAQNQQEIFRKLTIDNGLSQNNVTCILQDSKGFMWFGTTSGLNRYDSYQFTHFLNNPNDTNSITDNQITCLEEDSKGRIWVGTLSGGLNYYDPRTGNFSKYPFIVDKHSVHHIKTLDACNDSLMLIGSTAGIAIINYNKKQLLKTVSIKHPLLTESTINDFVKKNNQTIIIANSAILLQLDLAKLKLSVLDVYNTFDKNEVYTIEKDNQNRIWIGTKYGLQVNNLPGVLKKLQIIIPTVLQKTTINSLKKDHQNNIWIGTNNGLFKYNSNTNSFTAYTHNSKNTNGISHNKVLSVYQSNSGILWFGTQGGGVNIFDHNSRKFVSFHHNPNDKNSLGHPIANCFYEDKASNLWIGTWGGGVDYLNRKTNVFTHYKHNPNNNKSISNNTVRDILRDSQGILWITTNNGLNQFETESKTFKHFKNKANDSLSVSVAQYTIFEDSQKQIWLGCLNKGLMRYDRENKHFIEYNGKGLCNKWVTDIVEDQNGILWCGSYSGLIRYDKKNASFKCYRKNDTAPNSITHNVINCLLIDAKQQLWIGTGGGGLNLYRQKTDDFLSYRMHQGLPSDFICSILEDNSGNLWISTNNGLSRFTIQSIEEQTINGETKTYTVAEGLQSKEFKIRSALKTRRGELIFGGMNGFNIFHPDSLKINHRKPPVLITDFQLFYKSITPDMTDSPLKKQISETEHIDLYYNQNFITFKYVALNYTLSEKNQYAYKLKNFDDKWHYVNNERKATYTNLSPGEYEFQVRASNNDGVWNNEGTSVNITIHPPFWQTWGFRITVIALIIISIVGFYIARVKQLKKRQYELEAKVDERTKELQEANLVLEERQEEIQQQAEELNTQAEELKTANDTLKTVNKHITGSINYAKTIQTAILPPKERLEKYFDNFVIYRPKDIVSGDFYWLSVENAGQPDQTIFIAAVDCTGHGVPGAFMSMIGYSLLNEIVRIRNIYEPKNILKELHKSIRTALRQDISGNDDGMDVCLCKIQKKYLDDIQVVFSGAKRPLIHFNSKTNKTTSIKRNIKTIGGRHASSDIDFIEHKLTFSAGDILYLTTDGYIDQHNVQRKRFGSKRFLECLQTIGSQPLNKQKEILENTLDKYSEDVKQRDDITILAIKL